MGTEGSTRFASSSLRFRESDVSTARAPSPERNVRGFETARADESQIMAARVESERRFSQIDHDGSATDETTANATVAAIQRNAVRAKPRYRYERYAAATVMPLQLPLMATIPKSDATASLRRTPFFRNANASGKEAAAKNASELGFPIVQNARPDSQGNMAEAEKGSYQRVWNTAYGRFATTNPQTSARVEFLRKSESYAESESPIANKERNGRTEYVFQATASEKGNPGFDHDDHQKSAKTENGRRNRDEIRGNPISRYFETGVPSENTAPKSARHEIFMPS